MTNGYNERNMEAIEKRKSFKQELNKFSKSSSLGKSGRKSKPIDEREVREKVISDYRKSAEDIKNKEKIRRLERQQRYEKTKAGKIGRGITKGIRFVQNPTRTAYGSMQFVNLGKGRPKGSLTTKYARFGGVKNYRKFVAQQNRMNKQSQINQIRSANLTPQEQSILQQLQRRQQYDSLEMERRTFPDTTGKFDFSGFTKEISDAAGAVD